MKQHLTFTACFMLACIILIPFMFLFVPEGKYPPGTDVHTFFKFVWWSCGIYAIYILRHTFEMKLMDFLVGIYLVVFGPVVLLAFGFYFLYKKYFKTEVTQ